MKNLKTLVKKKEKLLKLKCYETARNLEIKTEAVKRSPIFFLITLIVLAAFLVVFLQEVPRWQVSEFEINNSIAVAQLENNYRATLAQIIGGFALLLGLYFTWRNSITAKESQIAELLTRAVDQLGNQNLEVKIGGIYALEKISVQSKKDHWPIMNILTAYIRNNSCKNSKVLNSESTESASVDNLEVDNVEWQNFDSFNFDENPKKISIDYLDIQAALNVIGRRKYSFIHGEPDCLDICDVDLQGSSFVDANLESIFFLGTNLKKSNFTMANLKWTYLDDADLIGACFAYSNLKGAYLRRADIRGANFEYAELKGANLEGADLRGTDLRKARNLSIDQLSKVKSIHGAKLDEKLLTSIKAKYPSLLLAPKEFDVYNDTRWGMMNET